MRKIIAAVISVNLLVCGGCAVFNRDNTPALNLVEQYLGPKEQTARALSYPLVVPVGMVAATTWKKLLLWGALLLGVLVLARMAWKLGRELMLTDSKKNAAEDTPPVVEEGREEMKCRDQRP